MQCQVCGARALEGLNFCPECGSAFAPAAPTMPSAGPQGPPPGAATTQAAYQPGPGYPPQAQGPAPYAAPPAYPQVPQHQYQQYAPTPYPQYPQPAPAYAPQGYAPQGYAPMGYPQPMAVMAPPKTKTVAALLCFFLGGLGIHRFYTGQVGLGVALLLQSLILVPITLGLWGFVILVWIVIDFVLILSGGVRDQYGRPLA